jgi:diguanylate cyclase
MKLNLRQKVVLGFFILLGLYWILLFSSGKTDSFYNYFYSFLFGLIPLGAGFAGMLGARQWGMLKSAMGRGLFFLSFGLLLWGLGEMVWSYYNFFVGEAAPYPSWADLGFGPSIFFWIVGVINLSKASGAKFGLRSASAKVVSVVAAAIMVGISYYMLVVVARGGAVTTGGEQLKVILDIAYPLGDLLALTVAVLTLMLSRRYLGGQYKNAILSILVGLAVMYFGDFAFSYSTTVGTYHNGNWGDLLLTIGLTGLSIGALGLCSRPFAGKADGKE